MNFAVPADNSDSFVVEEGKGRVVERWMKAEVYSGTYQDGMRPTTLPPAAYKCS